MRGKDDEQRNNSSTLGCMNLKSIEEGTFNEYEIKFVTSGNSTLSAILLLLPRYVIISSDFSSSALDKSLSAFCSLIVMKRFVQPPGDDINIVCIPYIIMWLLACHSTPLSSYGMSFNKLRTWKQSDDVSFLFIKHFKLNIDNETTTV